MRIDQEMGARLRVGLLLDSCLVPAWMYTLIERIVRSDYAEVALVVLNQLQSTRESPLRSFWQERKYLLYQVFNFIDRRLFLHSADALALTDCSALLSNVPILQIESGVASNEQCFSDSDARQIQSHDLDILVALGAAKSQRNSLHVARYGVWKYRWGDRRKIEDGLTGFWEVVRGWSETGAALQQLGRNAEADLILFETWFSSYPYSSARNRNGILWAAASFLPRQLERLHRLGAEKYFKECKRTADRPPTALESNRIPSNRTVFWIMRSMAYRILVELYRRNFQRERWELLFSFEPDIDKSLAAFQRIAPPDDRFWADPHVVYREPNYYIFIEEYLYKTRKGHIAVITMDQSGNCQPSIPVLQEDCHLSFPFVFAWMGRYYMIPESSARKTIDLYECIEFPHRWHLKWTLMKNVNAVDTSVIHTRDKWWLFTSIAEQDAAAPHVELFLFYADELFTDQWISHPMNPIVSDVKKARGAGRIFQKDGKLLRPSQDCSVTYGYGFDLNEITVLSETEFCERTVTSVRPEKLNGFIGTHTYALQRNLTIVDALARR